MRTSTTTWRISPLAWLPIGAAIVAESVSNALRAYGLGQHLDKFNVNVSGQPVSIAGAVLVLAAIAVSLTQTRAAWVAMTPGDTRQRIVAGLIAVLLLAISFTAMASHILEAQRAKTADEGGNRGKYDRAKAAYDEAKVKLDTLGPARPVAVIQAEVSAARIDMDVWRRSAQCSDITKPDTKAACQPILGLYRERGVAASRAELEPEVKKLKAELALLLRPGEASDSESAMAGTWGWLMGFGVVFIATFGTVIFANVTAASPAQQVQPIPLTPEPVHQPVKALVALESPVVVALRSAGRPLSNGELAKAMGVSPGQSTKLRRTVAGLVEKRDGKTVHISLH